SQLIGVLTQPLAASQLSSVQALLSSQSISVWTQPPCATSHVSVVQALSSSQFTAFVPHAPPLQTGVLQASPVQTLPHVPQLFTSVCRLTLTASPCARCAGTALGAT